MYVQPIKPNANLKLVLLCFCLFLLFLGWFRLIIYKMNNIAAIALNPPSGFKTGTHEEATAGVGVGVGVVGVGLAASAVVAGTGLGTQLTGADEVCTVVDAAGFGDVTVEVVVTAGAEAELSTEAGVPGSAGDEAPELPDLLGAPARTAPSTGL
jgi:hypothetical protein